MGGEFGGVRSRWRHHRGYGEVGMMMEKLREMRKRRKRSQCQKRIDKMHRRDLTLQRKANDPKEKLAMAEMDRQDI